MTSRTSGLHRVGDPYLSPARRSRRGRICRLLLPCGPHCPCDRTLRAGCHSGLQWRKSEPRRTRRAQDNVVMFVCLDDQPPRCADRQRFPPSDWSGPAGASLRVRAGPCAAGSALLLWPVFVLGRARAGQCCYVFMLRRHLTNRRSTGRGQGRQAAPIGRISTSPPAGLPTPCLTYRPHRHTATLSARSLAPGACRAHTAGECRAGLSRDKHNSVLRVYRHSGVT